MVIDQFINNAIGQNQNRVKVIAGDVSGGFWDLDGSTLKRANSAVTEEMDLSNNVKKLELKDTLKKDDFEPLVGAGVGALLGLRFFGLIGAAVGGAAGHLLTQHKPEISVNVELGDGRKFLAVMTPAMFQNLQQYRMK
ncbi:MAG: hypothetical protein ACRD3W_31230 [Terriglobales bacterium]